MTAEKTIELPASIALFGLGNMGTPMGMRLLESGYKVAGFDLSKAAVDRFVAAGGTPVSDAKSAARDADIVITLLPDGKVVRSVLEDVSSELKPGCIIAEMSSSDPVGTRNLGEALIAKGLEFVDAPVSGGVKRAGIGSLSIMIGGDRKTIERLRPLLSILGTSIFETGALGSGHAMKALNNYVSAAGLVAVVEAIAIGKNFGLDPELMADILNASTGRSNTTEVKLKQFILTETYGSSFPLKLMAKDVRTASTLANAIHTKAPLLNFTSELWDHATHSLSETSDHTEIGKYIANSDS